MPSAPKNYGQRFIGKAKPMQTHRGTACQRGYGSGWQRYRATYLALHPLCRACGQPASLVDHVLPATQGGAFWDEENHQPLCRPCHQSKTAKERRHQR